MHRPGPARLALWILAAALACSAGERDEAPAGAAAPKAPAATQQVPATVAKPARPSTGEAPVQPSGFACIPGDPAAGAALYADFCASCHGAHGDGGGPAAAGLQPPPARHDDGRRMNPLANETLFRAIREGGAAVGRSANMPAWGGTFSQKQTWDLVAFIRTLARPPYRCP